MGGIKAKKRSGNTGLTYLRVSSKGQVETELDPEGMSLPAQRRKCADKARESGLTVVDELVDSGVTATTIDQRGSYQQLIERVRTDESISFVMVYALSRLHRNWAEAGLMVMQLRNYGVRLLSATENIDDSTPEGQMMLGVIFSVSGFQSAASSKDLQYKMTQKAVVGGTPGWVPPGYLNVREQFEGRSINTVALDPERAPFIPLTFEWFATGQYTYGDLQDKLTEAGFLSRPNRRYPARPVSIHTVDALLRNRYYLGYVNFSGVEYQGRHQPLVSQELFDRVQEVRRLMPGAGNRQRRYHHYLKGMLWCERCGRRLIVMRGKSKTGELYFYYVCRGRQDRLCNLPYVRVAQVEQAVASHYQTVSLSAPLRLKLANLFDQAVESEVGQDARQQAQLRKRLAELDRQEDRYIELAVDPDWPKAKLTQKLRDIRDERARLEGRLAQTVEQLERGHANARRMLDYLDRPHELYARSSTEDRTKLNRLLFTKLRIDVDDDRVPKVTGDELTEPFATVVYLRREYRSVDGRRLNAVRPPTPRAEIEKGGIPIWNTAFDSRVLALLEPMFSSDDHESSSSSTVAEDAGFEPARGCPQPAFQASAIGH